MNKTYPRASLLDERHFKIVSPPTDDPIVAKLLPSFCCGPACGGAFCLIAIGLLGIALGIEVATWFQPTAVGIAWAVLFLAGLYLGTVGQYQFAAAAFSLAVVCAAKFALQRLTDLNGSECCLLSGGLATAGWLTSRPLQLRISSGQTASIASATRAPLSPKTFTWSIWDLGLLTTLVAACLSCVGDVKSSPAMLGQVAVALCGGLAASWSACAWAIRDAWNGWRLAGLGAALCGAIGLMAIQAPGPATLPHIAAWMLVGPLAVASAQGVSVLSIIALSRLDAQT